MKKHHLLVFVIFFTFLNPLMAAYVEKLKGKKVLIFLDGMSVNKGDLVYTVDSTSGKKKSILRITTVKDEKAIGQIVKGQAKINQEVIPKSAAAAKSSADGETAEDSGEESNERSTGKLKDEKTDFAIGGMIGLGIDSMDINVGGQSVSQSGMGYSAVGVLDYHWSDFMSFRGLLGIEQFNVSGDAPGNVVCTTCDTEITYITGQVWGRVNILQEATQVWLGAGFGIMHPMSKESNALDPASIETTAVYALGGGADIRWSKDMYIPIQLEYGMLPKSDDVETSFYGIRAGVMFHY